MRSPNEKKYWSRLDHLRFFAALLVMLAHMWAYAGGPFSPHSTGFLVSVIQEGHIGVGLFLVLTGYLFTSIALDNQGTILYWRFVKNRALRIFPLLTVMFFVLLCVGKLQVSGDTVLNLLLLQLNVGDEMSGFGQKLFPVGAWWTTSVEFQFYLIFPFILLFFRKSGPQYLVGLISVFILIRLCIFGIKGDAYWLEYHSIVGRMDEFLIGMLAAWLHRTYRSRVDRLSLLLLAGSLALIPAYCFWYRDVPLIDVVFSFTLEGIIFAALIIGYQSPMLPIPRIVDRILAKGGELTFSIYLLHTPIADALFRSGMLPHISRSATVTTMVYAFVILLPITLLVSKLTFSYIEKPFMDLRVAYFKKPQIEPALRDEHLSAEAEKVESASPLQ
ncbi:acyltransferase [Caballeronia sp. LZ062]|uniref:acyltransferase family protein n=1 Tax=unclassified Caballeronia TaxID=2646786 RepID=UPI00285C353F|nr:MULTISPECIES: acyltransferase [unclassified Caballeronia]MDR5855193.1 acyltransferase [Caballeronia sp. LZ050]MDR5870277.1 acyltransferase [Caballeronia sp. LZ062]